MPNIKEEIDNENQRRWDKIERNKKKSCKPERPNYGPGIEPSKYHEAGKGSKIRDIEGWYSEEVTKTLEKIFGKKEKEEK